MPFNKERANGESLIWLENSDALKRFEGVVASRPPTTVKPPCLKPPRRDWKPSRVIAIDGSNITHRVRNGFPGAEAGLIIISVVRVDVSALADIPDNVIPRPSTFHNMESARTVETVLPGANVVRQSISDDTPKNYFRKEIYETLRNGRISKGHETLLETYRALASERQTSFSCPMENCKNKNVPLNKETFRCEECGELLYETDALRLDERFSEIGTNGEVHGEFRHLLEILVLLNILRFFNRPDRSHYLQEAAFVLDGPLAMFGHTAWLSPYIRKELQRISADVFNQTGENIALFGFEKSGKFYDHFEDLDWSEDSGPRSIYDAGTVIAPDRVYVNRNIVHRPDDAKAHGKDTYFGRKILYKTRTEEHAVINTAMVTEECEDFDRTDLPAYPRLGDILDVMDHLATYLYDDGFMPLVRAHAHAAIPLQKGSDILSSLFEGDRS